MLSEDTITSLKEYESKVSLKITDSPLHLSTKHSISGDDIIAQQSEENLYIHEKKYTQIADKVRVSSRTYFKHRNLIKKVKTNCINLFEKIMNTCLRKIPAFSLSNSKNKRKRDVLRYFKGDISKLRNYHLLRIPMKKLISLFSDFHFENANIIECKEEKMNYLLNMTWQDYLLSIKNRQMDVIEGIESLIKISKKDFDIFFNYVYEIEYSYDLRPNVDSLYANSLEKIIYFSVEKTTEESRRKSIDAFIKSFKHF